MLLRHRLNFYCTVDIVICYLCNMYSQGLVIHVLVSPYILYCMHLYSYFLTLYGIILLQLRGCVDLLFYGFANGLVDVFLTVC